MGGGVIRSGNMRGLPSFTDCVEREGNPAECCTAGTGRAVFSRSPERGLRAFSYASSPSGVTGNRVLLTSMISQPFTTA
jgi:hypothetical protein